MRPTIERSDRYENAENPLLLVLHDNEAGQVLDAGCG